MNDSEYMIFVSLYALREVAESGRMPGLLEDVEQAENTAMKEILGISLHGKPLDYDLIFSSKFISLGRRQIVNAPRTTSH